MIDISTLSNNVAFMYSLALIILLLVYIAIYKKTPQQKSKKK